MGYCVSIFFITALSSYLICNPVRGILSKYKFLDYPNDRSSHKTVTIRGGGVAPLIVILIAVWLCLYPAMPGVCVVWTVGLLLVGGVSLLDDHRGVSLGLRLVTQITVAAAVIYYFKQDTWTIVELWMGTLVFVAFMNFVNFMDGINGLVTGMIALVSAGIALILNGTNASMTAVGWSMTGAVLGFLPHNFPSARMFLGDVGSVGLAFCVGMMGILAVPEMETKSDSLWLCILPLYFFLEGTVAIIRRWFNQEKWWEPHREHFYQRLVRSGWSHSGVASLFWVFQIGIITLITVAHEQLDIRWAWSLALMVWGFLFIYIERIYRLASKDSD